MHIKFLAIIIILSWVFIEVSVARGGRGGGRGGRGSSRSSHRYSSGSNLGGSSLLGGKSVGVAAAAAPNAANVKGKDADNVDMDAQESEEASKGGISLLVVFIFTFLLLAFGIIIGITIKLFAQCAMNLVDKDDEPHGEDTLVEAPEKDSDEEENDAASATSSVWTESESEDEISRDCPPSYEESVASPPYAQGPIADTGVS